MIIDFHSHIMPSFDDGAKDAAMSIEMLVKSLDQSVDTVVSTSHCYPTSGRDIDNFIDGRRAAYVQLKDAVSERGIRIPEVVAGAEVHLSCDLTRLRGIDRLCIYGTNYMLVEMPSSKWTDETIDRVYKLSISGIKPIIAHIERNLIQDKELLNSLYMLDVLFQVNTESFCMPVFRKFIKKMMKDKLIHIIGTDMHNLDKRPPNMCKAQRAITKTYGQECWEYFMSNARTVLSGRELSYRDFRSFSTKSIFRNDRFNK